LDIYYGRQIRGARPRRWRAADNLGGHDGGVAQGASW